MATDDQSRSLRLIVGLGNPGREYVDTRHNVGFMVVDHLANDLRLSFNDEKRWTAKIARDGARYLLKPQTYMNESGLAVGKVATFYKIDPDQILILYDDIDLPLGRLRIRGSGSAGGHNGMRSVINHLGTQDFPRLRLGIGWGGKGAIKHVLGKFSDEERSELEKSVKNAVLALTVIIEQGLPVAMTRFNAVGETKQEAPAKQALDDQDPFPNADTSVDYNKNT